MGLTGRQAEAAGDPAATLLSLAVLLQSGANPAGSWRHLAENGDPVAQRVARRVGEGSSVADAIASERGREESWGDVAAAWETAETVGAPLADTLRGIAASLREVGELRDDVRVALAEPMASSRLMAWLPLLGLVVGTGLGLEPLGVLFGTTPGLVCLAAGIALVVLARVWTRRLVRAAQPAPGTPGMREELLAVALSGGVSEGRAREVLDRCDEWTDAVRSPREADRVLALSRAAGVPAVELLRASAAHARYRARVDGRLRGARLGTRLLLPMGMCTLPAFLLLGVAPMLLGVLTATPIPTFAG